MNRFTVSIIALFICLSSFGQEKIKYRKLEYRDFKNEFGFNDTALAVMDIYFDKKENSAYGQMSFLPITTAIIFIPHMKGIGIMTTAVSLPFFIHGSYILVKYRKKKLYKVLTVYTDTKELPKWLRRKVNKQLALYKAIEREY